MRDSPGGSGAQNAGEPRRPARVAGEDRAEVARAEVAGQHLAKQVAEVGGRGEVAALVELRRSRGRASARAPARRAPRRPARTRRWRGRGRCRGCRSPATVRPNSVRVTTTTSLHAVAEVACGRRRARRPSSRRRFASCPCDAALGGVVVPAADLGERHLHAHVRLDELRHLLAGCRRSGRAGTPRRPPGGTARDRPSSGSRWPRRSPGRSRGARRAPRPRTSPRSRGRTARAAPPGGGRTRGCWTWPPPERVPASERGSVGRQRHGAERRRLAASGCACRRRFIQPSSVALRPGVPLSMKSWASKCERVASGLPTAWTDGQAASPATAAGAARAPGAGRRSRRGRGPHPGCRRAGAGIAMVGRSER